MGSREENGGTIFDRPGGITPRPLDSLSYPRNCRQNDTTMSTDLQEARKHPLFNHSALTKLIWAPRSRKTLDSLVAIIDKEPLFRKQDKSAPPPNRG